MADPNIFDSLCEKYDRWYEKNEFAYLSEVKAIKKALPEKGKGLEIGVGTGRFASVLGIKEGVEPSSNMLKVAEKRGVNAQQARGEALPFSDSCFDYVVIIVTICFVDNPLKVLKESFRVLKKGGVILLGIVDKESFLGRFYKEKESSFYNKARLFGVKELSALLTDSGFSGFSYYQTLFDFPEKLQSVQSPEKGFGKGGFVVLRAEKDPSQKNS